MRATRRNLLQLPLLVALVGCTPDPTVHGTPGDAPEPVAPTRSPEASAVATWVAELSALVEVVSGSAGDWGADDVQVAWLAALSSQSAAHLSRVEAQNPVVGGPAVFPTSATTVAAEAAPSTPDEAVAAIAAKVGDGASVLQAAVAADADGASRLFHASIATAAAGGLDTARPPAEGGAEPAPFPDRALPATLALALSHVWALLRGLELGLGRLDRSDELQEAGRQRLDSARDIRNALLAALSGEPPEVEEWSLPNAMGTPGEILAAWAVLEASLLDALGVLVAADGEDPQQWLDAMLGQVPWVHRWGGRLPHWPGWVAAP